MDRCSKEKLKNRKYGDYEPGFMNENQKEFYRKVE
jgi:hypothetical protein